MAQESVRDIRNSALCTQYTLAGEFCEFVSTQDLYEPCLYHQDSTAIYKSCSPEAHCMAMLRFDCYRWHANDCASSDPRFKKKEGAQVTCMDVTFDFD